MNPEARNKTKASMLPAIGFFFAWHQKFEILGLNCRSSGFLGEASQCGICYRKG
jgi:hypothetical protein